MPAQTKKQKIYQHYLDKYAEAESQEIPEDLATINIDHLIAIPAFDEDITFLQRLKRHCEKQENVMSIVIVNQPDRIGNSEFEATQLNTELFKYALTSGNKIWQNNNISFIRWENNCHFMLIDRFSKGRQIPHKQGVGLARKIACDLAIAVLAKNKPSKSNNPDIIYSSDADATLPNDYFQRDLELLSHSAACYDFNHSDEKNPVSAATLLYEKSLHYYVDGLRWAGSSYAFHTIGSCLAFSALHYCQVRGFPKRSGGEDFYLLNKLAKLAPIKLLTGKPITLRSRNSNRVPFGTGPAVSKILQLETPNHFLSYDPGVFKELCKLIRHFDKLWDSRLQQGLWTKELSRPSQQALEKLNISQLFTHINKNVKSARQCKQQIRFWFDAFRTLRFIHELQDVAFPAIPLTQALQESKSFMA